MKSRLLYSSSRFSRSPQSLVRAINKWLAEYPAIDTFGFSEMSGEERAEAATRALEANGFNVIRGNPGFDESMAAFLDDRWRLVAWCARDLGVKFRRGRNPNARVTVITACVEDKYAKKGDKANRLVRSFIHAPAHVGDQKFTWRDATVRQLNWLKTMRAWRRHMNQYAKVHHADAIIGTGDLNRDVKKRAVRAYFRTAWARWSLITRRGATFGKRLIDASLAKARFGLVIGRPYTAVVDSHGSSDHDALYEVVDVHAV